MRTVLISGPRLHLPVLPRCCSVEVALHLREYSANLQLQRASLPAFGKPEGGRVQVHTTELP